MADGTFSLKHQMRYTFRLMKLHASTDESLTQKTSLQGNIFSLLVCYIALVNFFQQNSSIFTGFTQVNYANITFSFKWMLIKSQKTYYIPLASCSSPSLSKSVYQPLEGQTTDSTNTSRARWSISLSRLTNRTSDGLISRHSSLLRFAYPKA